jgi:3-hydroxyacyl-CoA dehydrogenase/enoyl-CoA hydratase/3-hydroxybutyryl-CoA epimerase
VAARGLRFVQSLGKLPVLVKDSPGFLVNRILLPYMIEAGELFAAGASPKEIDAAMLDFGMPMGPLRLTDEVGVDVAEEVSGTLAAAFPGWIRVPPILARMVAAGLLGRKAGKGFFRYGKGEPVPGPEARELQAKAKTPLSREVLTRRMALLMVNEAARCLEEGIVATAADVDFAMVMGTGFAPFRGGPLRYADALGTAVVVEQLETLSGAGDERFRPCALLAEKAKKQERFYET